jgi:hypothetical protein
MFWLSCMFITFLFLPFFSFHFFYLQKPLCTSAISNLIPHVRTFEVKTQKHFAVLLLKKSDKFRTKFWKWIHLQTIFDLAISHWI